MTNPSAVLDRLPLDILHYLLECTDEDTIWTAMATSKRLRQAGEVALKPYLPHRAVTVQPPFVTDIFNPISRKFASENHTRRDALRKVNRAAESRLNYPPAKSSLKSLTLEVRDDDDSSGYPLLRKFAPQLETLHVHFHDRLWEKAMTVDEDDEDDDFELSRDEILKATANSWSVWKRVLDYSDVQLPALTTLSISSTARVLAHFGGILESVPNLRHLALSSHWDQAQEYGYKPLSLGGVDYVTLDHLETVVLSGDKTISYMAEELLYSSGPALKSLTLHFTDTPSHNRGEAEDPDFGMLIAALEDKEDVEELAVYGERCGDFMSELRDSHGGGNGRQRGLENLTHLLVDDAGAEDRKVAHGLVDLMFEDAGLLALKRLSCVMTHFPPSPASPSPDSQVLDDLFEQYPNLLQIDFLDGIPANPFSSVSGEHNGSGNIIHSVLRPDHV